MRSVFSPKPPPSLIVLIHQNAISKTGYLNERFKYRAGNPLPRLLFSRSFTMGDPIPAISNLSVSSALSDDNGDGDGQSGSVASDYAEVVVIRHGETMWNSDGRIQGHLDVELNEVGRQQAVAVAERLSKEPKISAVYSSDLKRALKTAEAIASTCGGLEVIQDKDLRERNLGDLQGFTLLEAPTRKAKAYEAFKSKRTDKVIPGGGESIDQLYDRCTSALERIGKKHKGERVVVVTHGGVLRALHERASPEARFQRKILNTSVNIFHISDEQEQDWTIKTWGDVSHLSETGFLKNAFGGDNASG